MSEEGNRLLKFELDNAIVALEVICFSAGYRDGVADLMAAMTFNEAELTNVAYIGCSEEEGANPTKS